MLISERIYQYMSSKGISQKEFSNRTGISQSTISDWKRKGTKGLWSIMSKNKLKVCFVAE